MGRQPAQEDFTEVISMSVCFCQAERNRERDRGGFIGRGVGSCKGSVAGVTRDESGGAAARGNTLGSPLKAVGRELLGFLRRG